MSEAVGFPNTGVKCLAAIAQYWQLPVHRESIISPLKFNSREPSAVEIQSIAVGVGLQAMPESIDWETLLNQSLASPLLARLKNGNWVVVIGRQCGQPDKVAILDPLEAHASVLLLRREQFCSQWEGDVIFLATNSRLAACAA